MNKEWKAKFREVGATTLEKYIHKLGGQYQAAHQLGVSRHAVFRALKKEQLDSLVDSKRVFLVSDIHDAEYMEKTHLEWLGKWVKDGQPDEFIINGDFANMDSLSTHNEDYTISGKRKENYMQDIKSMDKAMDIINKASKGFPVHLKLGNHDARPYHFEERHPATEGLMGLMLETTIKQNGWSFSHEHEYLTICGVDFIHVPQIPLTNKAFGGKNIMASIGRDAKNDVCMSHTHRMGMLAVPKLRGEEVKILNTGHFMPPHYKPRYIGHNAEAWSSGVWELIIRNGTIESHAFISYDTLKERYK